MVALRQPLPKLNGLNLAFFVSTQMTSRLAKCALANRSASCACSALTAATIEQRYCDGSCPTVRAA